MIFDIACDFIIINIQIEISESFFFFFALVFFFFFLLIFIHLFILFLSFIFFILFFFLTSLIKRLPHPFLTHKALFFFTQLFPILHLFLQKKSPPRFLGQFRPSRFVLFPRSNYLLFFIFF